MKGKKAKKTASAKPLTGIRVLVGRARHQASALSSELRRLGATVLEIPFIEIRQPRSFKPLDAALKNLDEYDWLILTSVNGVEAMGQRMEKLKLDFNLLRSGQGDRTGSARKLSIAAIGPATKKAIEQRGIKVDVVPKEYVAESVVRSLRRRVKGKRVLLVRAKVARDVIPRELRKAGALLDVIEAYETVVPASSRTRLQAVLKSAKKRPHLVTFTSSSTVRNFVALVGARKKSLAGIRLASIGPVTSSTLRELGLEVGVEATEFTIPGLIEAIVRMSSLNIIPVRSTT